MNMQSRTRHTKRADAIGASAGLIPGGRLDSRVTVLAIEQSLAELGIHAKLSDIVAKARLIENELVQASARAVRRSKCAE